MQGQPDEDAAWTARKLLRGARAGSLATRDEAGQPFASLVTPAAAPDGSVLMLLSGLSPHTRHLRADGRCSVMVMGAPTGANPQTAPRLTLTGQAVPEPDVALKARWVALHPYAAFYAELRDFRLWRLRVEAGQFVGGFASAHRLRGDALRPGPDAVAALEAAEPGILAHMNTDHADACALIARAAGGAAGTWRMVAVDVDGCDLMPDADMPVLRVPWSAPVRDAGDVRQELIALTHRARDGSAQD